MPSQKAPSSLEVLDSIQATLARHLAQTPLFEQGTASTTAVTPPPFEALDENLARIQDSLDRANRGADAADALANSEIEALRKSAEALSASRKRISV